MLYSPKSSKIIASRKIYDLVISDTVDAYWCDIFSGETIRISSTDPKLSRVKKPYFDARLTELLNHMNNIKMDNVNKVRLSLKRDPGDSYKINENDIYLAVMAVITKAKYIMTEDTQFTNAYNNTFEERCGIACAPKKFLSIEKFFY
jgi:predicted nucleic acid-binding protein